MKKILWTLKSKVFLKNNSLPTYFGIGEKYLDIMTMRYRKFGAVWQIQNGYRYIMGYWFSDHKNGLFENIYRGQWANLTNQEEQISDVYQIIREAQERKLWEKRVKLPQSTNSNENWKNKKNGWYMIKSNKHFPCSITCIHKLKHSLWIEHVGICESENDIKKMMNLINLEHNITFISKDISI